MARIQNQKCSKVICTKINPTEIRAKHGTPVVRDGGFDVTAELEILNEDWDERTGMYSMEIGLHYPRRLGRPVVVFAIRGSKDGKPVASTPPEYMMSQLDFDAVMRGEKIAVPTRY
ncbi:MAG TPA: hypothetical protein VGJ73_02490 [Verrucomicrobiae bacterium]